MEKNNDLLEKIRERLKEYCKSQYNYNFDFRIAISSNSRFSDFQLKITSWHAQQASKEVATIVHDITTDCNTPNLSFTDSGEGYINIRVEDNYLNFLASEMYSQGLDLSNSPSQDKVMLDYFGPNIAKPLHLEHLRCGVIGESLRRSYLECCIETYSDIHYGDSLLQMAKVIKGAEKNNLSLDKVSSQNIFDCYKSGHQIFQDEPQEVWQTASEIQESHYKAFIDRVTQDVLDSIKPFEETMGFYFNYRNGESFYYDFLKKLISSFRKQSQTSEIDGTLIYSPTDLLLQNQYGCYVYETIDFAAILHRAEELKLNKIIYVITHRQAKHWKKVFASAHSINPDIQLIHVAHGRMLDDKGVPITIDVNKGLTPDVFFQRIKDYEPSFSAQEISHLFKIYDHSFDPNSDYIFSLESFCSKEIGSPKSIWETLTALSNMSQGRNDSRKWKILNLCFTSIVHEVCQRNTLKPLIDWIKQVDREFKKGGAPMDMNDLRLLKLCCDTCLRILK